MSTIVFTHLYSNHDETVTLSKRRTALVFIVLLKFFSKPLIIQKLKEVRQVFFFYSRYSGIKCCAKMTILIRYAYRGQLTPV